MEPKIASYLFFCRPSTRSSQFTVTLVIDIFSILPISLRSSVENPVTLASLPGIESGNQLESIPILFSLTEEGDWHPEKKMQQKYNIIKTRRYTYITKLIPFLFSITLVVFHEKEKKLCSCEFRGASRPGGS